MTQKIKQKGVYEEPEERKNPKEYATIEGNIAKEGNTQESKETMTAYDNPLQKPGEMMKKTEK